MKWVDNDVVMNWYFETNADINNKQVVYAQHRGFTNMFGKWEHYCKLVTIDKQGATMTYYKEDNGEGWELRL